jgi:hypothetical protein
VPRRARRVTIKTKRERFTRAPLSLGACNAETSVPLKTADPEIPFTRLSEFGVTASVPSVAEPPDASVIRNLLSLWTRIHQQP